MIRWHTNGFLTVDQVRLVGTYQVDKVPVDQPLHIASRGEGNLALVILIIEIKKETRRSLFFCFEIECLHCYCKEQSLML